MITMAKTTTSSMRVNAFAAKRSAEKLKSRRVKTLRAPAFLCTVGIWIWPFPRGTSLRLLLQAGNDADEWCKQRQHDRSHNQRQKDNHERLQHGSQSGHCVIDLLVVNVGDFQKHLGQFTGLFAHIDHADYHGREGLAGLQRLHDRFALGESIVQPLEASKAFPPMVIS